jgi:hypothetical protein
VHVQQHHYHQALSEYFHVYRFLPKEPLLLLCIGCTFINLAASKKAPDRNRAVLQGFAFLEVRRESPLLRSRCSQHYVFLSHACSHASTYSPLDLRSPHSPFSPASL